MDAKQERLPSWLMRAPPAHQHHTSPPEKEKAMAILGRSDQNQDEKIEIKSGVSKSRVWL
ncbi:hypothetical protein A7K93_07460 [Candidatus Methylacidiphilum fumarolicum]|nr:hypothetical protein A7K93_07460 [Candidatus Methylacidiphilum fumarolicum]TFE75106.1 hypothetical protein A7K72_02645 [Candidatus Methylacidiphilum fumarolicum]TFE76328.1 hypothetical protein A7D33_10340 [Candidatus Methylacidiphilum fumarolicum]